MAAASVLDAANFRIASIGGSRLMLLYDDLYFSVLPLLLFAVALYASLRGEKPR